MASILVIDDDELIRSVLRQVLEADGHAVADLPDGTGAADLSEKFGTDLAIIDLIMPDQEGLATIMSLRAAAPDLKIIAMSGGGQYFGADFLKVAALVGADRTIAKPFERAALLSLVHELLATPPAGDDDAPATS